MSAAKRASPASPQNPPKPPPTAKQEKAGAKGTPETLAGRLLAAGIPVVVCRPCPGYGNPGKCSWRGHEQGQKELHQPKGWPTITAADCDLSGFRPGVDVLAMVGGHGIDLVDVDSKAGGSVAHLPPFASYGKTRTPSGGEHYVVPSSGFGKVSPFDSLVGHVGDYVGGRPDGTGRLLGYLPGSARPKYPGDSYRGRPTTARRSSGISPPASPPSPTRHWWRRWRRPGPTPPCGRTPPTTALSGP